MKCDVLMVSLIVFEEPCNELQGMRSLSIFKPAGFEQADS